MSTTVSTRESETRTPAPTRRLIAAGVKRGTGPLAVQVLSPADRERHTARCYSLWAAATNFRRHAKAVA